MGTQWKIDHRFEICLKMMKFLTQIGHTVIVDYRFQSLAQLVDFKLEIITPMNHDIMVKTLDYLISFSPYKKHEQKKHTDKTELVEECRKLHIPVFAFDSGWLPFSMVLDRKGLFKDSYYYDTIRNIISQDSSFNRDKTVNYCQNLIKNKLSKRPQIEKDQIPEHIKGKYIFIPGQILHDLSIWKFAPIGMDTFIARVTEWANKNNIPVVFKMHPGIISDAHVHGKEILVPLVKSLTKKCKNFYSIDNDIYTLIKHARFTACVNSGSIIDNLVVQSPVYSTGHSIFTNSGAIVYDPDLETGLNTMLNQTYDWEKMKEMQLRMVNWLKNTLLFLQDDSRTLLKKFIFHLGLGDIKCGK